MPLLDHFHPPLRIRRHWEGLHSAWANEISRRLNELLPSRYFSETFIRVGGRVEVDVATFDENLGFMNGGEGGVAVWAPPRPSRVEALNFNDPDLFEIRVQTDQQGPELVAAIELVSPGNKDRPSSRHMFAVKCASYLQQGIGLVMVDVVTERSANLHDELFGLLDLPAESASPALYAGAYRTVSADRALRLESWYEPLQVGSPLPTLPLWIAPDRAVPLELERAYQTACRSSRID